MLLLAGSAATAAEGQDLTELSLEELLDVEVVSASRKEERLFSAPSAVSVISSEDIERSAANSVTDLLRTVPGVFVGQLGSSYSAVSIRGFPDRFSNKLLVMVNGRTIYNSLFSGVYWELNDIPLREIDRIEIVRGPGASAWGANAVNGVINIITKSARDTLGGRLSLGAGTEARAFADFNYGTSVGDAAWIRVFGKFSDRDAAALRDGSDAHDDWTNQRGGFRLDWDITPSQTLTIETELYDVDLGSRYELPSFVFPYTIRRDDRADSDGGHVLARWTRTSANGGAFSIQAYVNRDEAMGITLNDLRNTYDIEIEQSLPAGEHHRFMWGAGFRYVEADTDKSPWLSLNPEAEQTQLYTGFLQDEISLLEERLHITLGAKIEHNGYTGIEFQPSIHAAWTPSDRSTLWASVSRAIRTPSQVERDGALMGLTAPGLAAVLFGNRDFDTEELVAFEAGYRGILAKEAVLDIAIYRNLYDDLRTFEVRRPILLPRILIPIEADNNGEADTYGVELALRWSPVRWWRLSGAYSYTHVDFELEGAVLDPLSPSADGETPMHQASLQSDFALPRNVQLGFALRYVDDLPSYEIDSYLELDARVSWRPHPQLELALGAQNLLDAQHGEFYPKFLPTEQVEIERSVYGQLSWDF